MLVLLMSAIPTALPVMFTISTATDVAKGAAGVILTEP